jgi:anti-sigma factor RsiW
LSRVPAIPDERYEQVWRAIAERTISEKQQDRIRVSALIDGELPDSQRARAEQCLADHPELAESTAIWKKLAAATKALPVPKISEMAARVPEQPAAAAAGPGPSRLPQHRLTIRAIA